MIPEWFIQIAPSVGVAIAIYTGIRVDLATTKQLAEQANDSANAAHRRIDRIGERPNMR